MTLRKLDKSEHDKTRQLWEDVFKEDTKAFLDYYYSVKTAENEIYVIEEDDKIVSMLHLNPYQMRIGEKLYQTHYIVAVATDEAYRKRGYMAQLLNHAMQVMAERKEPFTFLMPAAEAIYKPFGFQFVYEQKQANVRGKQYKGEDISFCLAEEKDCKSIVDYANEVLKRYDVVTWRDENYYKMLLEEQASEDGGILLVKEAEKIVGVFCFAKGERVELREPLFDKEELLQYAIYTITGNETEEVHCTGYGTQTTPMIMAKILQPDMLEDFQGMKVFINEVV